MKSILSRRFWTLFSLFIAATAASGDASKKVAQSSVDESGTWHVAGKLIPYSDLASPEARRNFIDFSRGYASFERAPKSVQETRLNQLLMIPGVQRLRSVFAVDISPTNISGVPASIIVPKGGVGSRNGNRVLINLHGGGMNGHDEFATLAGQMESIPVVGTGAIKVIALNYREGPDWSFPAASEDVAKVYGELLKAYRSENIGIFGCSAGAGLTAESIAWFQAHDLPRPGAIGLFGWGALGGALGVMDFDSSYFFTGGKKGGQPALTREARKKSMKKTFSYLGDADLKDPLVSPVYHSSVLRNFPPTLLISGTRDIGLSPVVYTHSRLVDLGVDADLHIWEGAPHCSYAAPVVDPNVPETRQAWKVITAFFDEHLGTKPK